MDEKQHAMRENLTEKTLVLFDLLLKSDPDMKDIKRVKKVAVELLELLKAELLKIDDWQGKDARHNPVKWHILDYLSDYNTGLPVDEYAGSLTRTDCIQSSRQL